MEKNSLSTKILDHYARGELKLIEEVIFSALNQLREKTIGNLEEILTKIEGKLRLAVLEILTKDGQPDLIPLFINTIRNEKNMLYAKSQILLFKEFKHQQALVALLSLENDIAVDLRETFQRTLGRLLSQFSEQFYMSEFRAGLGDSRRVEFAANMMLRSPHESYIPFLNECILENDMGYRTEGIRVLKEQGDASSSEAIFAMLSRVRKQIICRRNLLESLQRPTSDHHAFYSNLVDLSGLQWSQEQKEHYRQRMGVGEVQDALGQILDAFLVTGDVRKKTKPFLKGILCGGEPSQFQMTRTQQALDEYGDQLEALLEQAANILGVIARREENDDFIDQIEQSLSYDQEDRDRLIISSLAGLQSDKAFDILVEYVNTCEEADILESTLHALEAFEVTEVPRGVEKMCFDEENGVLRRKALDLLARWGQGSDIINKLLESNTLAVAADAAKVAAEYELEDSYLQLLDMLRKTIPDSLLISVIEALSAFNLTQTGRSVKPMMLPPYTFSVRKAALETVYKAGGPDRLDFIVKSFHQAAPGTVTDSIDYFLTKVLQEDWPEKDAFVLKERELWFKLMISEPSELQPKLILMAETVNIKDPYQARAWVLGLKKVITQSKGPTDSEEIRRIRTLIDQIEEMMAEWNEKARKDKTLKSLIDGLLVSNVYQRTQALRTLIRNYSPELVADNPTAIRTIVNVVAEEMDRPEQGKDMAMQVVAMAAKMRHPKLHSRLTKFLEYPHIDVREATRKALEVPLDENFTRPVNSIFIMDDSRYITKQLSKVLAKENYDVDFENSVMNGLDQLGTRTFDLLILDVVMPQMSGVEFLQEARRRNIAPDFTLVITSSRNKDELSPLVAAGIDGLLLKPFRMEELIERIRGLVPVPEN